MDEDIKWLKRREIPDSINNLMEEEWRMNETVKLNNNTYFGKKFNPSDQEIHELIEMPETSKEILYYKGEAVY